MKGLILRRNKASASLVVDVNLREVLLTGHGAVLKCIISVHAGAQFLGSSNASVPVGEIVTVTVELDGKSHAE